MCGNVGNDKLAWPGPCKWKSVALKAIEQTADGVLYPDATDSPITVTEIQGPLRSVYLRSRRD